MDSVSGSTDSARKVAAPSKGIWGSKIDPYQAGVITPEGFPRLPLNWQSFIETVQGREQGEKLFQLIHIKEKIQSPHPTFLFLLHGLGEHCGRYFHFPFFMDSTVDGILSYDQAGHGRSEGLRGHIQQFDDWVADAYMLLQAWKQKLDQNFGHYHLHLFGHSMGGLVALRLMHSYPDLQLDSAIISSPALALKVEIPFYKKGAAHVLSQIWGSLQMKNEIQSQWLSHDPAIAKAYEEDSLVHHWGTPRLYTQFKAAMQDTLQNIHGFRTPTLFVISGDDRIVDADASKRFAQRLRPPAQVKIFTGYYHESFNESDASQPSINKRLVFEEIQTWIRQKNLLHS